ncbi:hypothetical protein K402DRAFT_125831 [Aulographum hederae CBS 113979]|uniref:Uncharacterized protein n=1 Tax=Aulographum hederae CBS 113979 TaxID=1176131 RepID=A0A6G1HE73_9PEZI|nr:hypothetical protein K402DRAFT_125831 [Aulographum hederae CBS 113979]
MTRGKIHVCSARSRNNPRDPALCQHRQSLGHHISGTESKPTTSIYHHHQSDMHIPEPRQDSEGRTIFVFFLFDPHYVPSSHRRHSHVPPLPVTDL